MAENMKQIWLFDSESCSVNQIRGKKNNNKKKWAQFCITEKMALASTVGGLYYEGNTLELKWKDTEVFGQV